MLTREYKELLAALQKIRDMVACKIGNGCTGGQDHVGVVVSRCPQSTDPRKRFLSCKECGLWIQKLTEEEADYILCLQAGEEVVAPVEKKVIFIQIPGDFDELELNGLLEVLGSVKGAYQFMVIPSDLKAFEESELIRFLRPIVRDIVQGDKKCDDWFRKGAFHQRVLEIIREWWSKEHVE